MAHTKELLLNQLLANANDPSWYLPFTSSVKNVSEEDAFWKPNEASNSIAEIVQHLIYWNKTWQTRFIQSDVHAVPSLENNDQSFIIPEGQTFDDLKNTLLDVLLQWQKLLTEEKLDEAVRWDYEPAKWWELIGNATSHNAYHIGQIIYIRKQRKSWES